VVMRVRTAKDMGLLAREQRKRRGWGQAELAERVGVSRQWVVAFERGKSGAPLGLVLRTLHELGLELDLRVGGGAASASGEVLPSAIDLDALLERARRPTP
jgi:HTH-type transcriptional regulator/antitoxin HipB